MFVKTVLEEAYQQGASDLHLCVGQKVLIRLDGQLKPLREDLVTSDLLEEFCKSFLNQEQLEELNRIGDVDLSLSIASSRVRINIYTKKWLNAAFRFIPSEVLSLKDLGLGETFENLCGAKRGLILVTGPTGSKARQ